MAGARPVAALGGERAVDAIADLRRPSHSRAFHFRGDANDDRFSAVGRFEGKGDGLVVDGAADLRLAVLGRGVAADARAFLREIDLQLLPPERRRVGRRPLAGDVGSAPRAKRSREEVPGPTA